MSNDAMIISVDEIRFTYLRSKRFRAYAVGIAADNLGKVMVSEPPSSAIVRHRRKRPAIWDFGGDGYPIYQRTGGLPDIIAAHLLIVRDRRGRRKAGDIIKAVAKNKDAKKVIGEAQKALQKLSPGGLATATALGVIVPVATVVGEIISDTKDKVLQTISGSMFLDADRKAIDEFSDTVRSPDNNMEVEVDAFLFDAATDEDTTADTRNAEANLKADGLLLTDEEI